jgi:hypothetical protein
MSARDDLQVTNACLGDGNVKIYAHAHDRSREEHDEHREGGILKVGHLNLHATKLDAPADG